MATEPHDPTLEWTGSATCRSCRAHPVEHVHRYLLARELCAGRRVLDIACGEGTDPTARAGCQFVVGATSSGCGAHATKRYGRKG